MGIHCCNFLSDVIAAHAVAARAGFALMPCCHADRHGGAMKQAAALLGAPLGVVVDVARLGGILAQGSRPDPFRSCPPAPAAARSAGRRCRQAQGVAGARRGRASGRGRHSFPRARGDRADPFPPGAWGGRYGCGVRVIDPAITPENRILGAAPPAPGEPAGATRALCSAAEVVVLRKRYRALHGLA